MGSYKEKNCPTCGTTHRKQGIYCSRSCGNARSHTLAHKRHLSKKQTEHMSSADANEQREKIGAQGKLQLKKINNRDDEDLQEMTLDDFMVEPQIDDLPAGKFRAGGDLWTEVD